MNYTRNLILRIQYFMQEQNPIYARETDTNDLKNT